jgi:Holliday junction resolvasome RuvABC ATP-dependent DNA helicase subunit
MDVKRLANIAQVFTPGAPIDEYDLFAGRMSQARDVVNAIMQRGQHVVLFGERGVGKTSLANVLSAILGNPGFQMLRSRTINCDESDDFSSLWRKIFRELPLRSTRETVGIQSEGKAESPSRRNVEHALPDAITPDDVRYALQDTPKPTIIIIDELDRLRNTSATTLLADTIKTLSDHAVKATLVLIGVADSVNELIAEHQSIERAVVQVKMPRMSEPELLQILDKGLARVDMTIEGEAKARIAKISQGLPYYAHLLGLYSAQEAATHDRTEIGRGDVEAAIHLALHKVQQSIKDSYDKAIQSHRKDNLYRQVLLACALAQTDDFGRFAAADVRKPMRTIMRDPDVDIPSFAQHLNAFSTAERGPILHKTGMPRRYRFRFLNPLMQPFVILHGLSRGLLTEDTLRFLGATRGA